MTVPTLQRMMQAARLTRAGALREATALLLKTASAGAQPDTAETPRPVEASRADDPDVIDLVPPALPNAVWTMSQAAPSAFARHPLVKDGVPPRARFPALGRGVRGKTRFPRAPEPLPQGASFTAHHYADTAGGRDYKLYVPSQSTGAPMALLVMLHGCTQTPDDFAAGTQMNALAEEHGFWVAYPAQSLAANANGCWNWFEPGDQRRDSGEPALIAGITREILRQHPIDPHRVFVAGLSAGGAAAAVMAATYPDLYAAAGIHSGLPTGAARDLMSALTAMRQGGGAVASPAPGPLPLMTVPTIVFHGDRDKTVHPINGEQAFAQATSAAQTQTTERLSGSSPGGLAYTRTTARDATGACVNEHWRIHGAGHAWSGGSSNGSYTEPRGPDASREMLRFFMANPKKTSTVGA